ncbi:MAG: aminotransferase class I/II-fold pyridoxal phosphate-dependent enzyme, partial [Campylobacterota bacterium]
MRTYSHGGDICAFAKEQNIAIDAVIDLSSNINFTSPKIGKINPAVASYPNYDKLLTTLATHYGVRKEQVGLFNGGSSAIFSLMEHLSESKCYIYSPAYVEYKKAASLYNKQVIPIDRYSALNTKIDKNSLVVFVNPATPDGVYYKMRPLLQRWQ